MRINLGEIIIDKESYFKASLKNPKQMNSEEENNLNKIKEKDLFPTFVKTNFVLDHISHNDFRNFTFEQIKRSLSESDFKKVMSVDKTLQELVAKEDDYIKLISEYLGHKDIGKDTSEIEKKLETNLKEIHALRREVDGAIKQTGLTIIDLKTETKIKEISLYKEILELNNLDSLSNMDKINLISNLIEVQSKIGNLSNISEEDLKFNRYSNELKAGLKSGDLNEVELTSLYNNLLMSMDKFYDKISLNNDSFEKNPTFALYKSEINDFQSRDNYLKIVEAVKNENPDLLAKKYKQQDVEVKNKEEVASSSFVDIIKDTIDSMEDIEIGGFKL